MNKKRVVITGLGVIGPLGIGVEKSWQALCEGKSGIHKKNTKKGSDAPKLYCNKINQKGVRHGKNEKRTRTKENRLQYLSI